MGKSLFVVTKKDLVKLSVVMLLAVIFFGLTGLIIMLCFQWITLQSYAADPADKHGIAQVNASRLGGAAIFFSWLGLMLAEASPDYVFVAVGPSMVPELKSQPKRALICILGTLLGGMLSVLLVLIMHYTKKSD